MIRIGTRSSGREFTANLYGLALGLRFRVQGLRFRVPGLGFRAAKVYPDPAFLGLGFGGAATHRSSQPSTLNSEP